MLAGRCVDQRQHDTVDLVLDRPIRREAHHEPSSITGLDLAFHVRERRQHCAHVILQVGVVEPMRHVRQRPPDIGGDEVEHLGDRRRIAPNAKLAVQEQRTNVRRIDEVDRDQN